jgi:hypothetical protein
MHITKYINENIFQGDTYLLHLLMEHVTNIYVLELRQLLVESKGRLTEGINKLLDQISSEISSAGDVDEDFDDGGEDDDISAKRYRSWFFLIQYFTAVDNTAK